MPLKVIVGLGNPGPRYEYTRHNAGFWVVDAIARGLHVTSWRRWMNSEVAKTSLEGTELLLVKPQTFMNVSGDAVQPLLRYYRLTPDDLLVVYDDLDLPAGSVRVRAEGSAGGHRGVQSLIVSLGTPQFARIRIGVGRPPKHMTSAEYVLQSLPKAQRDTYDETVETAAAAAGTWALEGTAAAMNKYNGAMP